MLFNKYFLIQDFLENNDNTVYTNNYSLVDKKWNVITIRWEKKFWYMLFSNDKIAVIHDYKNYNNLIIINNKLELLNKECVVKSISNIIWTNKYIVEVIGKDKSWYYVVDDN